MTSLRKLHLYLGCIFAPVLIFLACTGALQLYDLHESRKDGSYIAPKMFEALGQVHKNQNLPGDARGSGRTMKIFMLAAAAGLVLTTVLGVVMAFRVSRSVLPVFACLATGVVLPLVLLYFVH
jgi:hypothetical protein